MSDNGVLKNIVLALAIPLTPEELDKIAWLAQLKRAAILNLPKPKKPGIWGWIKARFAALRAVYFDRKAFTAEVAKQAERVCVLEDLLEANKIDIPGGRES